MEDMHTTLRSEYGPLARLITWRRARAYSCESIADYLAHRTQMQPTTVSRFSDERCTFAGCAFVHFKNRTSFNYAPDGSRCDMSDLTGSVDVSVAPLLDKDNRVFGLSLPDCNHLLALGQKTFGRSTCIWNPTFPALALVGYVDYEQITRDRFRNTDFNLPDYMGYS